MKSLHHYKISASQLGSHLFICQSFVLFNHKEIKIQYTFNEIFKSLFSGDRELSWIHSCFDIFKFSISVTSAASRT